MGKRFLIQGETTEKIFIGVELSATSTSLNLYLYTQKKGIIEELGLWLKNEKDLPKGAETIQRTIADQNLLPEEIKVKDVGKVRLIENAWAEALIQTRLFQSFDSEINILQESVAALEDYSEELFKECSGFWKRVLDFKRENKGVDDKKIDNYKIQLDILFEVLKSLRKDHKKVFDHKSIENKELLTKLLDEADTMFKEKKRFGDIYGKLKIIRTKYSKMPMRQSHKKEIDDRINLYFERTYKQKQFSETKNTDKRISDLETIISKMNKAIDWKIREIGKEENNLKFVDHVFQEKLIMSKIETLNKQLEEIKGKVKDVNNTLKKLVQKSND